MSDSGLPQIPPGGRYSDLSSVLLKTEQAVSVEAVRGQLRHIERLTRIQAEIIKLDSNGNATLRTADGDEIDLKIRGRVTLQEGQKMEIELPPGNPPRQAVIRSIPLPDTPVKPQMPLPAQGRHPAPATSVVAEPPTSSSPPPAPASEKKSAPSTMPPEIRAILNEVKAPILPLSQPLPKVGPESLPGPVALDQKTIFPLLPLSAFPPSTALLPEAPLPSATLLPLAIKNGSALSLKQITQPLSQGMSGLKAAPVALLTKPDFYMLPDAIPAAAALKEFLFGLILTKSPPPLPSPLAMTQYPVMVHPLASDTASSTPILTTLSKAALLATGVIKISEHSAPPLVFQPQEGLDIQPPKLHVRIASVEPLIDLHPAPSQQDKSILSADKPAPLNGHSSPVTFPAQVIGVTQQQHFPVLSVMQPSTKEGLPYLLQSSTLMLPVGATVELLPQSAPPAAGSLPVDPLLHTLPPLSIDFFSGWTWPVFDDALDILSTTPESAQNAAATSSLAKILPSPANPAQMANAILFFVAAIRSGDVGGWMGEKALNILKREGGRGSDVLEKMTREISGLSRLFSEPLSQDWRGMPIPYLWQNEVQKIHLFYRHQGGDDQDQPEEKKDRGTRFIFDLHLDRVGDVQLDGLMKNRRLDLILRTHTPFAHGMQRVMRQKYLDILENGKLEGDLAFQTRKDQWIKVDTRQTGLKTTA